MKSWVQNGLHWFCGALLLFFPLARTWAQAVVSTITVDTIPRAVSVNPVTNMVYVAVCPSLHGITGTVAVIDGATNAVTTITAGLCPFAVAVNPTTDRIYIANIGSTQGFGYFSGGSITVIDGATNSTTTISDPDAPQAIAVNPATNKIYVANHDKNNVMIIDGDTNSTTTITDPNATGIWPVALAVNQTTNKIYVANKRLDGSSPPPGNVTVIDGATNTTSTITDPNAFSPVAIAVNTVTNKIYVANEGNYPANNGNVTVIDGATNSTTTVTDPNALAPQAVAVNQITNKIYVANINDSALTQNGGVTVIDGATKSFSSVKDPDAIAPVALAVDETKNKIYVVNEGGRALSGSDPGSVTVIDGEANSTLNVVDPNATAPVAVSIDSQTNQIYVANISSNNITVIGGATAPSSFTLSVTEVGSGSGAVSSSPAGIDCGSSCRASFAVGTVVVLTASPVAGSMFSGWSGPCSGTSNCSITMTSGENVTATFNVGPPPDFSLTAATATLSIQRGGQMADVITIAPLNGSFSNAVQLTCSVTGSTPPATCSLSSTSVTPAANPATSALMVTAPTQMARLMPDTKRKSVVHLYAVFLALPSVALIGIGFPGHRPKPRRRRRQFWLLCGAFIVSIVLQAGCGGGSSNPPPPLNYTVTVTATSGVIQHTTQVSVTVP
jgi:DNA-binding beta-propeller fold protein YncE